MSNKKVVALNTMSQLIGKGVSGVISFIISIILAKALGVDGYGDFTKIAGRRRRQKRPPGPKHSFNNHLTFPLLLKRARYIRL